MVTMTQPYIPGFLAFREAPHLEDLVTTQRRERPELTPSLLVVDGNGLLHPRQAGLACHIGVELQTKVREDFTITEKAPSMAPKVIRVG